MDRSDYGERDEHRTMSSHSQHDSHRELSTLVALAFEAWPGLELDRRAFAEYLTERMGAGGAENVQVADLYLAFGCAAGHAGALKCFEAEYSGDIDKVTRRFERPSVSRDDLGQLLREKLLVARDGRPPKIADYSGRGFLQNWLRVTAVRTFLDETRRQKRRAPEQLGYARQLQDVAGEVDPELDFLKLRYRGEFKGAFARAVGSLTSAQRNLLRHQVLAGLTVDQIGAIYHVHRATAARRVARAREALLKATRRELMRHLSVSSDELDSIMALIQSNLDVSMQRVLRSGPTSGYGPEGG